MPDRDYTKTYTMLEHSFYDHSFIKPGSESSQPGVDYAAGMVLDGHSGNNNHDAHRYRALFLPRPNGSPTGMLPPTPPSNTTLSTSSAGLANGYYESGRGTDTPTNSRSLPTPDTTPPSSSDHTTRKPFAPFRYGSPYAESFTTAREEWSESGDGSHTHLPLVDSAEADRATKWLHSTRTTSLGALGLVVNATKYRSSLCASDGMLHDGIDNEDYVLDKEWAKNATLRRKRLRINNMQIAHGEVNFDENNTCFSPTGRLSLRDNYRAHQHSADDSPIGVFRPGSRGSLATDNMASPTHGDKRCSGASFTSTIVEAVLVETPPQGNHKLRHVGKNLALREGGIIAERDETKQVSSCSERLPVRRLVHKNKHIPEKHDHESIDSSISGKSAADANKKQPGNSLIQPIINVRDGDFTYDSRRAPTQQVEDELITTSQYGQLRGSDSGDSPTQRMPAIFPHNKIGEKASPIRSDSFPKQGDEHRDLSKSCIPILDIIDQSRIRAARKSVPPKGYEHVQFTSQQPTDNETNKSFREVPMNNERGKVGSDLTTVYEDVQPGTGDVAHKHQRSVSSITTESMPRMSFDCRSDSYSSTRHLFVASPMALGSEAGASEVYLDEAKAVSIYTHNQNSLLVVQHPRQALGTGPMIMIEPSMPLAAQPSFEAAETPLENPRRPPELPVVAVIPPTPSKEIDQAKSPNDIEKPLPPTPTRRGSLLKQMRRYSDPFIQPIVTFTAMNTGSVRRRNNVRKQNRATSQSRIAARQGVADQNGNLYPFWQPRGFWDDLSDDEDDLGYGNEHEDRLPAGGDTSDFVVPDTKVSDVRKWRRGGSLRKLLSGKSSNGDRSHGHIVDQRGSSPTNGNRADESNELEVQEMRGSWHGRSASVRNPAERSRNGEDMKRSKSGPGLFEVFRTKIQERAAKKIGEAQAARG